MNTIELETLICEFDVYSNLINGLQKEITMQYYMEESKPSTMQKVGSALTTPVRRLINFISRLIQKIKQKAILKKLREIEKEFTKTVNRMYEENILTIQGPNFRKCDAELLVLMNGPFAAIVNAYKKENMTRSNVSMTRSSYNKDRLASNTSDRLTKFKKALDEVKSDDLVYESHMKASHNFLKNLIILLDTYTDCADKMIKDIRKDIKEDPDGFHSKKFLDKIYDSNDIESALTKMGRDLTDIASATLKVMELTNNGYKFPEKGKLNVDD